MGNVNREIEVMEIQGLTLILSLTFTYIGTFSKYNVIKTCKRLALVSWRDRHSSAPGVKEDLEGDDEGAPRWMRSEETV